MKFTYDHDLHIHSKVSSCSQHPEQTTENILVAIFRKIVLLLPLIYLVPLFLEDKTAAVYLAEPICNFLAVSFTSVIFAICFKKAIKKIENPL